jgi:serine O-acetyltransferase
MRYCGSEQVIQELNHIRQEILESYRVEGGINHLDGPNLPSRTEVSELVARLVHILFPGFFDGAGICCSNLESWCSYHLADIHQGLTQQIARSIGGLHSEDEMPFVYARAARLALDILKDMPRIRCMLRKDVEAAFEGDPAASSLEEVIVAYPSILAVALYRIAHVFYRRRIPLIPRMISEEAHTRTGIDIHPGAEIGEYFFIDHGTGVVIGETCVIGNHAKIYQMVTLGALSFAKNESGHLVKGRELKRHPTIEDNVILYAGCTILGGDTVIGEGAIIGGNVWITSSVPARTVITFDADRVEYRRSTFVNRKAALSAGASA